MTDLLKWEEEENEAYIEYRFFLNNKIIGSIIVGRKTSTITWCYYGLIDQNPEAFDGVTKSLNEAKDKIEKFFDKELRTYGLTRIPKGWKLVPEEPTKEMINYALPIVDEGGDDYFGDSERIPEIYKAMLAVAPKPEGWG